jgi:hypothetical protein
VIDPFTALSLAAGAVSNIKSLLAAGQDASQAIAKFAGAYSDINYAAEKAKNPPWWKFSGSAEEEAINIFTAQKKIQQMRQEVETTISFTYGPKGLEEYKEILRRVRKQRQDNEYRKEEITEALILWGFAALAILSAAGFLALVIYFIGKSQAKW